MTVALIVIGVWLLAIIAVLVVLLARDRRSPTEQGFDIIARAFEREAQRFATDDADKTTGGW